MIQSSVEPISLSALFKQKRVMPIQQKPRNCFRSVVMKTGILESRKGSSYVELGTTRVTAIVDGPKQPTRSADIRPSEGVVRVSVNNASGINHLIESAMQAAVCLNQYPKTVIEVEITVLDDDGGALSASLMAASLALCDSGIQMLDICLAANVIILDDDLVIVDPYGSEMIDDCVSATIGIMPALNQVICCKQSGLATIEQLSKAISTATDAAYQMYGMFRSALESFTPSK